MNLKELIEKRAAVFGTMQALIDKAKAEQRELSPEEAVVYDSLEKDYDALADPIARARKHEARVAEMAQSLGTVVGAQGGTSEQRNAPMQNRLPLGDNEMRAMAHYLRTGDGSGLGEQRAYNNTDMNIGTAADGGYAVPTGLYNQIIARRDETLLAPKLGVRNIPGKGLTVRVPIDAEADVLFTVETEAASLDQDAPALYYKDFTLAKYAKYITLSWELLRDEDANLLSFVNDWIGRGVAATHNSALITEALANGTAGLTLDSASAIGATEVPELVGKLAPEYQDGAQWILAPGTVATIQGLNGTPFYFAPAATGYAGKPMMWGYPVNQSSYASAIAASAKTMIFGNFSYMGMREVTTINMLRDPYSVASAGQIRLWFWFDMVYGVLQAEAIQYATHPTA
jgi:HK97 family phage major capsid protein